MTGLAQGLGLEPALVSNGLSIETITSAHALASLQPEWRLLASSHGAGLPFMTWEWHDAWWRHFRENRIRVRVSPYVLAFRASGDLVAVAPMMITRRPVLGLRILDFFGAGPHITELRGVLCDPHFEAQVHRALLSHVAGCARDWDWVCWRGMREGSPAERVLAASPDLRIIDEIPDYVLPLAASWDEFKATRSRNLKESLRKCYNSLRRDGHVFALEVATTPGEVAVALQQLFRLHRARAERQDTVRHVDVFASPAARRFLVDVSRQLAERNGIRIFQLRVGREVVAARIGFTMGTSMYLYYSGYDPRWSRYSVMTTTVAEAIKYAIGAGFQSVNLSIGTDVSKTRWGPEAITYRSAIQPSPSLRGRFAHLAYHNVRELVPLSIRELTMRALGRRPYYY